MSARGFDYVCTNVEVSNNTVVISLLPAFTLIRAGESWEEKCKRRFPAALWQAWWARSTAARRSGK